MENTLKVNVDAGSPGAHISPSEKEFDSRLKSAKIHSMKKFSDSPLLMAAYRHILRILQPVKHYPYHNIGHTLDVFRRARELAQAEGVGTDEQVDLLLAALFHDTGFIESYGGNEQIGARIAREWLQEHGHPEARIVRVEEIIMATIPFTTAKGLLEKIIQDADLDNFGREDCFTKMWKVEEELRTIPKLDTPTIYSIFWRIYHDTRFQTKTSIRERQAKRFRNVIRFERLYNEVMGPKTQVAGKNTNSRFIHA